MLEADLRAQIIQRLLAVSDAGLAEADISEATSFRDLDLSSLILVMLASELENELGIDINDDELIRMQTIGDLFRSIENSQKKRNPSA